MKKIAIIAIFILVFISVLSFVSSANEYEFKLSDDDLTVDDDISAFFDTLPEDIRNKLFEIKEENSEKIIKKYSFDFFMKELRGILTFLLPGALKSVSVVTGMIVIVSIFNKLHTMLPGQTLSSPLAMCSSLVFVLTLISMQKNILSETEIFLSTLSDTMLIIVPVMEALCIASGNFTLMTVTSTSLNLMITFTVNLFTKVIFPVLSVSFIMAIFSCVTRNQTIVFISKALRGLITAAVVLIMTLMTFSLTLQTNSSVLADNFTNRTIRYALGSYIPIVGGTVSETYSLMQSSVSLLKNLTGTTSIVILILICLKPIISITLWRLTLCVCKNISELLGCNAEALVFEEMGAGYTLLLSIVISCVVMYIIALAQFSKTSVLFS